MPDIYSMKKVISICYKSTNVIHDGNVGCGM